MSKQEFFLLIPAIIYGVAIVDLLKIFAHKDNYFEMVGWGLFYLLAIIIMWMELFNVLNAITTNNLSFILIISQSILYARGASIITPEEKDTDTKAYFMSIKKNFFLVMAGTSLCNMLIQFVVQEDNRPVWFRTIMIALAVSLAYWDRMWFRMSALVGLYLLIILHLSREGGLFGG